MEAELDPAQIETLRNVALHLGRRLRRHSGAHLTPAQMSALSSLDRNGASLVGELARREQIGKSSATRLIANLERAGYVARQADAADARGIRVSLTDTGRRLLSESSARSAAYLRGTLTLLAEEDRRLIVGALPALERLVSAKL
jgi:DNA-binding MarR family transcriptional regulator